MTLIQAFRATGATGSLAVTTSSGSTRAALGTFGDRRTRHVRLFNGGAATAFFEVGLSTVTAAAATSIPIASGATEIFGIPNDATHIAAITAADTATLYYTPGEGI
jgi:hypothetical protein